MAMDEMALIRMMTQAMSHMHRQSDDVVSELDRELAISVHMDGYNQFATLGSKVRNGDLLQFKMSTVNPHCSPSVPLQGLRPIPLSKLKVGKVHRGRVVVGRLCVDAFIVTAVATVLEDEQNPKMAVRLSLYNVAPINGSFSAVQKLFPKGTRVAVKEPFLKRCQDGYLGLRVDNPASIEKLGEKMPQTPGAQRLIEQGCNEVAGDADELRRRGNSMFGEKDWTGAIDCYTKCITAIKEGKGATSSDNTALVLAYSNRAEAWMRIECWQNALQDSRHAMAIDSDHVKSAFRKGKALHGLQQYTEACSWLKMLHAKHPDMEEITASLNASRKALHDQRVELDALWESYLLGKSPSVIECSNFIGPVLVKRSEGRGRGLFATVHVMPGDFLLVNRAVAECERDDMNTLSFSLDPSSKSVSTRSQEDLVTKLASLAIQSPVLLRQLYALSSSADPKDMPVPEMDLFYSCLGGHHEDGGLEIDIERIRGIVKFNAFAAGGSGLWLLPSFINHSCIPNANIVLEGSMMVIQASSEIVSGEEITISYFNPFLPLNMRREVYQGWNFQCRCMRCTLEESLQYCLEPLDTQMSMLFKKANIKSFLSAFSGTVIPAFVGELSQAFKKAKGKISSLHNLTLGDRNILLASFSSAFLAKWFLTWHWEKHMNKSDIDATIEVLRAMISCHPANPCTKSLVARMAFLFGVQVAGKNGKYSRCADAAGGTCAGEIEDEWKRACVLAFGRLKPHVLEQVLDHHIQQLPVSLFAA